MADAITFAPDLSWVDVPNPNEPPPNAHFIAAADLLRYENFGKNASALLNAHALKLASMDGVLTPLAAKVNHATTGLDAANTKIANLNTNLSAALDLKAPKASPTFTGTVSGITKAMVGLGNVDNTSDANKPVSTLQKTYIDAVGSRVTTLEGNGKVWATASGPGNASINSSAEFPIAEIPSVTFLANHVYAITIGIKNFGTGPDHAADIFVRHAPVGSTALKGAGDVQMATATIWTYKLANYGASDAVNGVYLPTTTVTRRVYLSGTRVVGEGTIVIYAGASLTIKDLGVAS